MSLEPVRMLRGLGTTVVGAGCHGRLRQREVGILAWVASVGESERPTVPVDQRHRRHPHEGLDFARRHSTVLEGPHSYMTANKPDGGHAPRTRRSLADSQLATTATVVS